MNPHVEAAQPAQAAPHYMPFPRLPVPPLAHVLQQLSAQRVAEPRKEACERLLAAGLRDKVQAGQRIAITASSRDMGGYVEILAGVAAAIKACGGEPFIVPAMGSHGGAIAEGQAEILRRLGVTEQSTGAPICATIDTVVLGKAANGAAVHLDKLAAEADGIIVVGRVHTHPQSNLSLASGLLKMIVTGLGKQRGAQEAHNHGLWDSVREVPKLVFARAKIILGLALVENAFGLPLLLEAVPGSYDSFLEADTRLLLEARQHVPALPFTQLDLLIVDELGKTISGTGMDLHVVGGWRLHGGATVPNYRRVVVLGLTEGSLGNGLGIGLADFTTRRFAAAYDPALTYVNALTAMEPGSSPRGGALPLALPTDREAIEVALYSALPGPQPRICRIKNTRALDEFWVSAALLDEVRQNPRLVLLQEPRPLPFSSAGNLF